MRSSGGLSKVQRDPIAGLDDEKVREPGHRRQAKDPGQERRRPLLVTAGDDGVIQLHAHPVIVPRDLASENLVAGAPRMPTRGSCSLIHLRPLALRGSAISRPERAVPQGALSCRKPDLDWRPGRVYFLTLLEPLAGTTGLWPLPPGRPASATIDLPQWDDERFTAHAADRSRPSHVTATAASSSDAGQSCRSRGARSVGQR